MKNKFLLLTMSMTMALGALVFLNSCSDDDPVITFDSDPEQFCMINPADAQCFSFDADTFCTNNPLDAQCCIPSQDLDCYCSEGDNATTDLENCCTFEHNVECFCTANPDDEQCADVFFMPEGAFVVEDFEGDVEDILGSWGGENNNSRSADINIRDGGPQGKYLEIVAEDLDGTNAYFSQFSFLNIDLDIQDTTDLTLNFLISYDQATDLPFGFHPVISDAYHVGDSIFNNDGEPENHMTRRLARFFHFPSQVDGEREWRVISIPVNRPSINWATWSNDPGLERGIWDFSFVNHMQFAVNLNGFPEPASGTIGIEAIWFQNGSVAGATTIVNQP